MLAKLLVALVPTYVIPGAALSTHRASVDPLDGAQEMGLEEATEALVTTDAGSWDLTADTTEDPALVHDTDAATVSEPVESTTIAAAQDVSTGEAIVVSSTLSMESTTGNVLELTAALDGENETEEVQAAPEVVEDVATTSPALSDDASQETSSQDGAPEVTASQETASQQPVSQDNTTQDMSLQDTASQEITSQENMSLDNAVEHSPVEQPDSVENNLTSGNPSQTQDEVETQKTKAQLWEVLDKLRDRRGTSGWQPPLSSYDIDAPTPEMRDASVLGHAVKIFLTPVALNAAGATGTKCGLGAAPFMKARRINVSAGPLRRSKIWFFDTLNYTLPEYVLDRAHCGHLNVVATPEEADLCFPSCDPNASASGVNLVTPLHAPDYGTVSFAVPQHSRALFQECDRIELIFQPQNADIMPCVVVVPAVHGVARPPGVQEQDAPWNVLHHRESLLSYIGGTPKQPTILDEMAAYAAELNKEKPHHIFTSPVLHTSMDLESFRVLKVYQTLSWELYSSAVFAWQGVVPARRSFYDCWMVGTIPVIPVSTSYSFTSAMDGLPFKHMLRNLAIVIPENVSHSGRGIIKHLQQISTESIAERRRKIRQVAPFLQYGWNERADAFTSSIGALVKRSVDFSEIAKEWANRALAADAASRSTTKTTTVAPTTTVATGLPSTAAAAKAAAPAKKAAPAKHAPEVSTQTTSSKVKKDSATSSAPSGPIAKKKWKADHAPKVPANSSVSRHAQEEKPKATRTGANISAGATPSKKPAAATAGSPKAATGKPMDHASHAGNHSDGNSTQNSTKLSDSADAAAAAPTAPWPSAPPMQPSSVMVDLLPDQPSLVDHSRLLLVVAICVFFIVAAGMALLCSPKLTESMRNPKMASV